MGEQNETTSEREGKGREESKWNECGDVGVWGVWGVGVEMPGLSLNPGCQLLQGEDRSLVAAVNPSGGMVGPRSRLPAPPGGGSGLDPGCRPLRGENLASNLLWDAEMGYKCGDMVCGDWESVEMEM